MSNKDDVNHNFAAVAVSTPYDNRVAKIKSKFEAKSTTTTTVPPNMTEEYKDSGGWQIWGDGNSFAEDNWDKMETCGLPQRIIEDLARIHFGGGIMYFKEEVVDNVIKRIPLIDAQVKEWLENSLADVQYGNVVIRDYYLWKMSAVEIVVDQINKKIIKFKAHDATMIRWGDRNQQGVIDKAFLSANWPYPTKEQYKELPVIDPLNPEEIFAKNKKATNFIYPILEMTPTHMYYPVPAWTSDQTMDWMENSLLTPLFHRSLLENVMGSPFTVYVHDDFWASRYNRWGEMTKKEKDAAKKETFDSLTATLTGAEKAGKIIFSGYVYDDDNNEIKGVKVEPIENKLNDKAFLMTNAQADSEISYTLGYDPSLMGHGMPGGKELSGSGSEKMRSLQNRQLMMASDRVVTLQFLNFVARFNKWAGRFGYIDNTPTTLDENKDGLKTQENAD